MNTPNDGGPAFPYRQPKHRDQHLLEDYDSGMSLRDWFAATLELAPREIVEIDLRWFESAQKGRDFEAEIRYAKADAMLAARNKEQP